MFRVSNLLRNARLDKELEFSEISKKLKIPIKYLEAIETERIKDFPAEPYCSLIVKDYANFLGLNGEEILSFFRRDFDRRSAKATPQNKFIGFTPQFTFGIGVIITIVFFSAYLIFEYLKFNRPPALNISWPDQAAIAGNSLEVKGVTDPEATIRVNNDLVIVDENGNFQKKVNLNPPETKITVESRSPGGKTTVQQKSYQSAN